MNMPSKHVGGITTKGERSYEGFVCRMPPELEQDNLRECKNLKCQIDLVLTDWNASVIVNV